MPPTDTPKSSDINVQKWKCPRCHGWVREAMSIACEVCRGEMGRGKLTRQERLQAAADAGFDTWSELRGER